jgi:hypothetical protein
MGWRYLIFAIGAITLFFWALRFFVFPLHESPRFLLGRGRDAEAVKAVKAVAAYNGREVHIEEQDLRIAGGQEDRQTGVLAKDSRYSTEHIRALFGTRKMALSTSLLITLWGMTQSSRLHTHQLMWVVGIIGLASTLYNSFLPYLLASRGAHFGDSSYYITYRNVRVLPLCITFSSDKYTSRTSSSRSSACPARSCLRGQSSCRCSAGAARSRAPPASARIYLPRFALFNDPCDMTPSFVPLPAPPLSAIHMDVDKLRARDDV